MQKVILHLVIYIRQLQKAVYLQYHYRYLSMPSGLHCFLYFKSTSQFLNSLFLQEAQTLSDSDPQNMTNINLKTCIETLSTIDSYSTTFLF